MSRLPSTTSFFSSLSIALGSWSAVVSHAAAQATPPETADPAPPATAAPSGDPRSDPPTPFTDANPVPSDGPTASGTDRAARESYLRGERFYAEGRYDEAATAFEEAHRLSGRPPLLFNIANAHERAGRYEEALGALRRYAPHAPAYDHDTIARRMTSLEERIERETSSSPTSGGDGAANAEIRPAPTPVPSTRTRLGARADDGGVSVGAVVTVASGVAFLGAGTVFALLARGAGNDAEDACAGGYCLESSRANVDDQATFAAVADVGFAVGAVATVVGAIWLLTDEGTKEESSPPLSFDVGPSHGRVTYRARF